MYKQFDVFIYWIWKFYKVFSYKINFKMSIACILWYSKNCSYLEYSQKIQLQHNCLHFWFFKYYKVLFISFYTKIFIIHKKSINLAQRKVTHFIIYFFWSYVTVSHTKNIETVIHVIIYQNCYSLYHFFCVTFSLIKKL